ncbi:MAG: gluconate 2-dehydrogenase subunit 3 family protein, partial [Cellulophaga sp.]
GYTVAAPTIFNMLASCNAEAETWTPLFLSPEEKYMVTNLVDIILPTSETPGALDVNIPQFLDLMYHDIEKEDNKTLFKNGARIFSKKFTTTFNEDILDGNKKDFEKLLSEYFNLTDEETEHVFKTQKMDLKNVPNDIMEHYSLYKFLLSVRYYTIFGYCTSEKVGEEILAYDPIPGTYQACIPLEEATGGKAWSL